MAKSPLRAVQEGETPALVKKLTVAEAAASGSHKALLIATRDRIASAVSSPGCPPRDLAALTRRLTDISKELEVIAARELEEGEAAGDPTADEVWTAI